MRHKNLFPHQNLSIIIAGLHAGHLSLGYPPFAHPSCCQWAHFGCHVGQRREQAPREQTFHCISENYSRATFLSKVIWNYLIVVIVRIASGMGVKDITKLKTFQPPQRIISVKSPGFTPNTFPTLPNLSVVLKPKIFLLVFCQLNHLGLLCLQLERAFQLQPLLLCQLLFYLLPGPQIFHMPFFFTIMLYTSPTITPRTCLGIVILCFALRRWKKV